MQKRSILLACIACIILLFVGCNNNKKIIGQWEMIDNSGNECGLVVTFKDDGTYYYGLDWTVEIDPETLTQSMGNGYLGELIESLNTEENAENLTELIEGINKAVVFRYKIKNNKEMIIKTELILGLLSNTSTVPYSINNEILTLDNIQYKKCDVLD